MTRIAQVAYHTSPLAALGGRSSGGLNVYVLELSRELAALGYEVDMFTRNEGDGPALENVAPNLRLIRIEAGPATPLEKEDQVAHIGEFVSNVVAFAGREQKGYQVVHSHYWQGARAGAQIARQLHAPHAVMFHTLGEVKNRARISEHEPLLRIRHERAAVRRADAIIAGSDHELAFLERYYGAEPRKVHTIPCGVDLELFHPRDAAAAKQDLGLDPDRPVLLWVGRLEKLKGVDILIGALAQLEAPGATLLLVGGAEHALDLKAELLAQAAEAGISDDVRFVGPVPHERLATYYNAADVCVVPSYYESFGLVAIEAMACGTPVVASRVGGLVSTVTDGVNGFLIPWRCPEPFAEKLDVLLHNRGLRANFGMAARRSVERFRWRSIALEVTGVYDSISKSYRSRTTQPGEGFGKEVYEAAVLAGGTP
jgi:D-inositol-3-phosphate glycosyltransferase